MVIGARGFLGVHLTTSLGKSGYQVAALGHDVVEITDPASVEAALRTHEPDIVVNCAAISSTSYAAEHPEESVRINVEACENLARACAGSNRLLYLMSSDQVYSGCPKCGPLPESLTLAPNNTYGLHKYLMEACCLVACPSAVILRLPWMFEEYNESNPHVDIISRLAEARRNGTPLMASPREYRGISNVSDICANIIKSFGLLPGGVYNFGATNRLDSYSTYLAFASAAGIPSANVVADTSWGRNLSMDCEKVRAFGIEFVDTVDGVMEVFG